jgi:PhnB protein
MTPPVGISPHLVCSPAAAAIDFYVRAMGAEEIRRVPTEDGARLIHAELRFGPTIVYLCDDFPEYCGGTSRTVKAIGGVPLTLHQYVPDVDAAVKRAADAGAEVIMPPADQFWGDRYAQVRDPFGYEWSFATPLRK